MAEPGDLTALEAQVQRAEDLYRRGEYGIARDAYLKLLADRLSSGLGLVEHLRAADLVVIDRLAHLSARFGRFDAADDLFSAIVAMTRKVGNDVAADYWQLKRVELSIIAMGALHPAFEGLRELETRIGDLLAIDMSLAGFERWEKQTAWHDLPAGDREVQFSLIYYILVRLLAARGQYQQAICAAERSEVYTGTHAVDLAQQARIPIALAHASALFELGDLDAAADLLQRIRRQVDDAGRPGCRVAWLEVSGRLDYARGVFASALERFGDVLQLCRDGGFSQAEATAHLNRAKVLILMNRIRDALEHLDEAERNAQVANDVAAMARVGLLRTVADARSRSLTEGVSLELSVTETLHPRARVKPLAVATPEPIEIPPAANFFTFFDDRALHIQWLLGQREFENALTRLEELQEVFGATQSRLIRTRLCILHGLVLYYRGAPEDALNRLAVAAQELESMRLKPELWQVARVQGWCAARLHRQDDELAFVERAKRLLDEIAGSLHGAERAIYLLNKWTAEEESLGQEIFQLIKAKAAVARSIRLMRPFAWIQMARRLNRIMARIDGHKALVAHNAIGAREKAERRAGCPSLLRRLLSGERHRVFLSFLVLPDRILVVRSGFCYLDFQVSATTRIELREQVRRWHELARIAGSTRDLSVAPSGDKAKGRPDQGIEASLADALQLPALLAGLPSRTTALTIVPDDALHGFPFAAVSVGDGKLIDRFAVSVAFTSMPARRRAADAAVDALLVAVSRGSGMMPPLPQTLEEVKRVQAWLEARGARCHVLIDDEATKSRVSELFRKAGVCHFACHGTFVPDQPDASGMVLIPDAQRPETLSLRDLSHLELSNCQHVTLSSCWSADNFILPGRWCPPSALMRQIGWVEEGRISGSS